MSKQAEIDGHPCSDQPSVPGGGRRRLAPALLPRLAVAADVGLGRLAEVPMTGPPVVRPISAIWRGGARDLTATSRELIEVAVDRDGLSRQPA